MVVFIGKLVFELFRSDMYAVQKYRVTHVIRDEEKHIEKAQVTVRGYGMPTCNSITYRIYGEWKKDPKYGWQITVSRYEEVVEKTKTAVVKYLSDGPVKGISKSQAEAIWNALGESTIDILKSSPERVREARGSGGQKTVNALIKWNASMAFRDVAAYLMPKGISASACMKIAKRYKAAAMDVVTGDPWRMMVEIPGISFTSVDKIAEKSHISPDSPERIEAAVIYALYLHENTGSMGCPPEDLSAQARKLLSQNVTFSVVNAAANRLLERERIFVTRMSGSPLLYRNEAFHAEIDLARNLIRLAGQKSVKKKGQIDDKISRLEKACSCTYSEKQKQAIALSPTNGLMVVTGGPGTGKTTVINGICKINSNARNDNICLLAPTGTAATRMSEVSGIEARTVDSKLGIKVEEGGAYQEQVSDIDEQLVICDEASMLDTFHAAYLVRAVKKGRRLIFVGDVDQLPSVGPGNVLRDVITSGICPVVKLDRIYRQANNEGKAIVENAYRINSGETDLVTSDSFHVCRTTEDRRIGEKIAKAYQHYAGVYGEEHVVCLLPTKRTKCAGVYDVNASLQKIINPPKGQKETDVNSVTFREGDIVMNTKNDTAKGIANGDVGRLKQIVRNKDGTRSMTVQIGKREVLFEGEDEVSRLIHAWAMTVHKSQGKEYDCVIIGLSDSAGRTMLKRNLLYTAVTRAKKEVLIIGSESALNACIKNVGNEKRHSCLLPLLERFKVKKTVT